MALGPGLRSYQVSLDRDLVDACDRLAAQHRLHRSSIIRAALRHGLPALAGLSKGALKDAAAVQLRLDAHDSRKPRCKHEWHALEAERVGMSRQCQRCGAIHWRETATDRWRPSAI